jgi:hypothetical protein
LSHILRGGPEQIFKLNRAKLLDNGALFADALMESFFKLIKFALFLVEVLNEPPSPLLHLMQPPFKSLNNACHGSLDLSPVLRMPHIMRDKFLNRFFPLLLQKIFVTHNLQLVHEAVNVLDQDVITCDKYLLLLAPSDIFVRGHGSLGVYLDCVALGLGVGDAGLGPFTVALDAGLLLGSSLVVHGVGNATGDTVVAHILFALLIRSRLDLARSSLVQILGR